MGNIPFPPPEVGDNAIETRYAKGIDFWNTIEDWHTKEIAEPPISDMRAERSICDIRDPHSPLVRSDPHS